jgi:hypothetical protein
MNIMSENEPFIETEDEPTKASRARTLLKRHKKAILISAAGVIAVVGLTTAGVLAYQGRHTKSTVAKATASPAPTKTATASPTPTTTASAGATVTPTPTPDNIKYLMISELGIKLPLTSSIYDLIYSYSSGQLHFSATSISSIPNRGITCSVEHDPLGTYRVYSSAQSNVGPTDSQVGDLVASVNGKYIYYHHVQYACGETPGEQAAVLSLIDPVHSAVQNAKPIQ